MKATEPHANYKLVTHYKQCYFMIILIDL